MDLQIKVRKVDKERQVVYGEVYPPNLPDSDAEFMTPDQIIDMAHLFLRKGVLTNIDTQHNNVPNGSVVVESWIEQTSESIYILGAWVIGVHVPDPELWELIESGEINGFSLEAEVTRVKRVVEMEVPEVIDGETQEADGHKHMFKVRFAEDGTYLGGETDVVNGHMHKIVRGTVTAQADGHTHRYSFVDGLAGLEIVEDDN